MLPPSLLRLLERRAAVVALPLLGVLLCAPALANGLDLDDALQAARFADGGATAWNLFALFGGDAPLVDPRDMPWWRHDAMRLELMRPLTACTHLFDLRWLVAPAWMHLHSLLWYGLLLAAVGRLYRRFLPGPHAWTLALLLYSVDHSHAMVVGWLAARSQLLGALGAVLCLLAHDRWRRDGRWTDAVLAGLALLAALLATEGAVGVGGYLAAYALCLDRGPRLARAASLLPASLIVITWRVCYVAAGFGTAHSGFYFDPAGEGPALLPRAVVHALLLVGSQIFIPLGEVLGMFPGLFVPGALVVAILLAALGWLLRRDLARSPVLRFWALGALLSALPLATTLPTDRQLLLIGLGVFGFAGAWLTDPHTPRPRLLRVLAWIWLGLHLVLSPLLVPLRAGSSAQIHAIADDATAVVATAAPRRVILVRAPSDLVMLYGRASRRLRGAPFPQSLQYLYAGLAPLKITRTDAHTLELRPEGGWLLAPLDRLHRAESAPFHAGEQLHRDTFTVEILEVSPEPSGRPLAVRVRFTTPLEHPDLAWFTWEGRLPRPYAPPEIGASHTIPAQPNPMLAP